jgi:hypothetical protein
MIIIKSDFTSSNVLLECLMEHKGLKYHSSCEPKRRTALFLRWMDDITKRWTNKMEKRNIRKEQKMKI